MCGLNVWIQSLSESQCMFWSHQGYKPLGCTSSIPVKYQTVVISNEEKKGFCSKSKRFLSEDSLVSKQPTLHKQVML